MHCLRCDTVNSETARTCKGCGAPLQASRAQLYLNRAEEEINKGQHREAGREIAKADAAMLAVSQEERDQYLLSAQALWLYASIYYSSSLMNEARTRLLQAQSLLEELPHGQKLLAQVLNKIGNTYYYELAHDQAQPYYERGLELAVQSQTFDVATKASSNIGSINTARNQIDEAKRFYTLSAEYAQLSDPTSLIDAYSSLLWLYDNHGPFSLALEYADRIIAIRGQVEGLEPRVAGITEVAITYARAAHFDEAEFYLREAYSQAQPSNSRIARIAVEGSLSELLQYRPNPNAWYTQAAKALNDYYYAAPWADASAFFLSCYYVSMGQPSQIRLQLQRLTANNHVDLEKMSLYILRSFAMIHAALGQFQEASVYYQTLLANNDSTPFNRAFTYEKYTDLLVAQARAHHIPPGEEARASLAHAADLYRQLELPQHQARMQRRLQALS